MGEATLADEFAAWDRLSDEALIMVDSSTTTVWPPTVDGTDSAVGDSCCYVETADLESLMRWYGERGYHVMVRYDPLRDAKHWTVVVSYGMLVERADTDHPAALLASWRTLHRHAIDEDAPGI